MQFEFGEAVIFNGAFPCCSIQLSLESTKNGWFIPQTLHACGRPLLAACSGWTRPRWQPALCGPSWHGTATFSSRESHFRIFQVRSGFLCVENNHHSWVNSVVRIFPRRLTGHNQWSLAGCCKVLQCWKSRPANSTICLCYAARLLVSEGSLGSVKEGTERHRSVRFCLAYFCDWVPCSDGQNINAATPWLTRLKVNTWLTPVSTHIYISFQFL